jgi:hypothetical protein
MVALRDWTVAAQWLNIILFAAVAMRLRFLGLHQKYPVFFGYLLFSTARSAALLTLDVTSHMYFWVWLCTEPIYWVMNILVVRELFSLVLDRHAGLGRLSRWLLHGGLGAGVILASVSLLAQGSELPGRSIWLWAVVVVTRCVGITVLVFLLALVAFLNWYPVSLSSNLIRHCILFAAYFLCMSLGYLVRVLTGDNLTESVNLLMVSTSAICASIWLTLSRAGEERRMMLRSAWTRSDERVMLGHLESFNAQLLRAARK